MLKGIFRYGAFLIFSTSAAVASAYPVLVPQSEPTVARGAAGSITFKIDSGGTRELADQIYLVFPQDILISGVTSTAMCTFPSGVGTNAVLVKLCQPLMPGMRGAAQSLTVNFAASVTADLGARTGVSAVNDNKNIRPFSLTVASTSDYNDEVTELLPRRTPRDVEGYWTEATMASATSMDAGVSPASSNIPVTPPPQASAFGSIPIGGVAPDKYGVSGTAGTLSKGTYSAIGKVYGTGSSGKPYYCSASVVPSKGKNIVVTAAHCVVDPKTGEFYQNWMFVPDWSKNRDDTTRYEFPGDVAYYNKSFYWSNVRNKSFTDYDFAAVAVAPNQLGENVEDLVGSQGIVFGVSEVSSFAMMGYPVNAVQQQLPLLKCNPTNSRFFYYTLWIWPGNTLVGNIDKTCHDQFLGGASGGPWLVGQKTAVTDRPTGYLFGVNSRPVIFYTGAVETGYGIQSVYFSEWAKKIYMNASGMTPVILVPSEL